MITGYDADLHKGALPSGEVLYSVVKGKSFEIYLDGVRQGTGVSVEALLFPDLEPVPSLCSSMIEGEFFPAKEKNKKPATLQLKLNLLSSQLDRRNVVIAITLRRGQEPEKNLRSAPFRVVSKKSQLEPGAKRKRTTPEATREVVLEYMQEQRKFMEEQRKFMEEQREHMRNQQEVLEIYRLACSNKRARTEEEEFCVPPEIDSFPDLDAPFWQQ